MPLPKREFGNTGLKVSVLGFGAGHIGNPAMSEQEAESLLHAALDLGINLFDTARSYGLSEERLGRHLRQRRQEVILSTKVGYGISGIEDWTAEAVTAGIDEALKLLQTDSIDIVHFHSCPLWLLQKGEIIDALQKAVIAGKVRVPGYSGDNEPLQWSIHSGRFGCLETSINLYDQRFVDSFLPLARERGMGVIAKRPVGNSPWRFPERPAGHYAEEYWNRWKAMNIDPGPYDWQELALRFVAFLPGVHSSIVGTSSVEHLRVNAAIIEKGPLPEEMVVKLRFAFQQHGQNWSQQT
jgi:aryl-alcohol dehydrogenase-like predicted oxidoreductase